MFESNLLGLDISSSRPSRSNREKVLIVLMVSEGQIDHTEKMLSENKYFGYKGIICVSQVSSSLSKL
jgi:hypothetical protein